MTIQDPNAAPTQDDPDQLYKFPDGRLAKRVAKNEDGSAAGPYDVVVVDLPDMPPSIKIDRDHPLRGE